MPGSSRYYFRERMLKIWKTTADFQNVYSYNVCLCSSVVLADVLKHTELQPCRWKRMNFCGRYLCFSFSYSHDAGFQRAFAWATSWEKMRMLIVGFPDEMWMLRVAFFSKKKFPSRPIKRLARLDVQPPCFLSVLVDVICIQTSAHWHPKL